MEERDFDGHTNLKDAFRECRIRELSEALLIDEKPDIKLLGFINDESTEAGKYHLAAIHRVRISGGKVRRRHEVSDQEFGENSWALVTRETISSQATKFDGWSQYIIHEFLGGPPPDRLKQFSMDFQGQDKGGRKGMKKRSRMR